MVLMSDQARLATLLNDATRIVVFTGAGVSTASGIPTYRGPDGIWKTRQPVYYDEFMTRQEKRVEYWQYKLDSWEAFGEAEPTPVHDACVTLERAGKLSKVITQNVDGLHRKAGTALDNLIELHGTNAAVECQGCLRRFEPGPWYGQFKATGEPPVCPECGGVMKPATISFGQSLRIEDLGGAAAAARSCDLFIAMGSTLSVTPAADIPLAATQQGTPYVIINQGETAHDELAQVTLRLEGDVNVLFPAAVHDVCGEDT